MLYWSLGYSLERAPKVLMVLRAMTAHIWLRYVLLTLDQQVVFSVARITGVANLPLRMWSSSKASAFTYLGSWTGSWTRVQGAWSWCSTTELSTHPSAWALTWFLSGIWFDNVWVAWWPLWTLLFFIGMGWKQSHIFSTFKLHHLDDHKSLIKVNNIQDSEDISEDSINQ